VYRVTLALFLVLSFNGLSQLKIVQLTDSVYLYSTYQEYSGKPVSSNSIYIVTSAGIVMIDTPWDSSQLPKLLDSMFVKDAAIPILSISTHFHSDRTAGLDYLDSIGVKTYSTALTKAICKEVNAEEARNTFQGDTTFVIAGRKISIFYPGAGHSPDNIVVYLEKENLLFGGCFVKSYDANSLGYTGDADIISWHTGIKLLIKKYGSVDLVIPGHGPWNKTESMKRTKKLLKKEKRVLRKN
jgi:glyoxylase-like metal-dependent hydrolase (beta-lactamase superfamily II)